jgi:hypothetical protein
MTAPLRHPLVAVKERPFNGRLRILDVGWNDRPSIADILEAQTDLSQRFRDGCIARVNGVPVPRAWQSKGWPARHLMRPLALSSRVPFRLAPIQMTSIQCETGSRSWRCSGAIPSRTGRAPARSSASAASRS